MFKKMMHIEAVLRHLIQAERHTASLVEGALARALRKAVVKAVGSISLSTRHATFSATLYRVSLKGKGGYVVLYHLHKEWGSLDYDHVEAGVAFYDDHTGWFEVLNYEGQHAGNEDFASSFSDFKEELRHLVLLGGIEFRRVGGDWEPRLRYEVPRKLPLARRLRRRAFESPSA